MAYTCNETEIQNVSGESVVLSMFRKGALAHGESFTIAGSPGGWIVANYCGIKRRRMLAKFNQLLDDDKLLIVSIPSPECGNTIQLSSSSFAGSSDEELSSSSSFAG